MSGTRVLHVVTLGGPNGEYGGPLRVARELCTEQIRRGGSAVLLFGILDTLAPTNLGKFPELAISVKPISNKYKVSSLISLRFVFHLIRQIKKADVVHVHFGRDIISLIASALSLLLHRPILLQTHGMVIPDSRRITKIVDLLVVLPILHLADVKLALSIEEKESLSKLGVRKNIFIQPNGISIPEIELQADWNEIPRVVFCSRLFSSKGIDIFLEIVERFYCEKKDVLFEIYGPDGGDLYKILNFVETKKLEGYLKYLGPIQPHLVQETLSKVDILVLPSSYDPYPMVVLEALSVGTSVVISNRCGQAEIVKKFDARFVPSKLSAESFYSSIEAILAKKSYSIDRSKIIKFCHDNFGIEILYESLSQIYRELIIGTLK
jgi:glycosyltransferase involved in cell wall biosynthesis